MIAVSSPHRLLEVRRTIERVESSSFSVHGRLAEGWICIVQYSDLETWRRVYCQKHRLPDHRTLLVDPLMNIFQTHKARMGLAPSL